VNCGRVKAFPRVVAEVISEKVAASGKARRLCPISLSGILGEYEKHTQKDRPNVHGFAGVAVKNTRCLAVGTPN
jgi:hypothetical protein